jgi:hypothetical protein
LNNQEEKESLKGEESMIVNHQRAQFQNENDNTLERWRKMEKDGERRREGN